MNLTWKHFAPVVVAIAIALLPAPDGLPQHAWYFFAIFTGVIVGLMFEPHYMLASITAHVTDDHGHHDSLGIGPSRSITAAAICLRRITGALGALFGIIFFTVFTAVSMPWVLARG